MGVIRTQTIKGTAYTYLGAVLGIVTNLFLLAKYFSTEEVGLLSILVSYSLLFAQFASLGFDYATLRLFPYFRNDSNKHNGFMSILISTITVGMVLSTILFFILKPFMIEDGSQSSGLFEQYVYFVIPLTLFTLLFNSFDSYSRVLFKSVRGTFLKEFLQRLLVVMAIIIYMLNFLDFKNFVIAYVIALSLPTLILIFMVMLDKQISLKRVKGFVSPELKKSMISVSFYGIIAVFSSSVILSVDRIMLKDMVGLSAVGIYSIMFFFGTVISMPSRSLSKISSIVVAEAWKNDDLQAVKDIYYKSCLTQMIFSALLLIGIWANIDNIFHILPDKYIAGKFVILWVCIGSFIDMSTGVNTMIISTSKYYKVQSLFMAIFVLIVILTNYIFIPLYGITGAGIANAISFFVFNLMRWIFLWTKYDFQPFNFRYLLILLFAVVSYIPGYYMPEMKSFIVDIIIRSGIIFIIFSLLIYFSKVSEDINNRVNTYFSIVFKGKKSN